MRCRAALEDGAPLRALSCGADDAKRLRGFQFLSAKPLLLVLNLDEADLPHGGPTRVELRRACRTFSSRRGDARGAVCAKIELEIAQLEPADAAAFLADLGLARIGPRSRDPRQLRPARLHLVLHRRRGRMPRLVDSARHAARSSRPARSTATSRAASSAPRSSATSTCSRAASLAACRDHGELRLEGKEYIVLDGDISTSATPRERSAVTGRRQTDPPSSSAKRRCRSCTAAPRCTCASSSRELRARGYEAELVSVPFKWYPKDEILPHAAAWRLLDLSESNGRPIDLVIAHEVPDLFRPASEQGRVADPSVPRGLRAVRHAVQRLRAHRARRRAARHADPARHRDARRVPARLRQRAQHRAARLAKFNGLRGRAALSSAAARGAAARRARTATTCSRSAGSNRSSAWTCSSRAMAHVDRPIRLVVAGDGTQRANVERAGGRRRASRDRVDVPRRRRRRAAASSCTRARSPCVYPPFDEDFGYVTLEAFLARKPVITAHRFRRPDRVRRRRRERLRRARRTPEALADADQPRSPRDRAARGRRSATPATSARGAITWDGVIEKLVGSVAMNEADHPDPVPQRGGDAAGDARRSAARASPASTSIEVLVIDDGSRDGTVGRRARLRRRSRRPAAPEQGAGGRVHGRHRRLPQGGRRLHRQHRRRQPVRRRTTSRGCSRRCSAARPTSSSATATSRELRHMSWREAAAAAARQLGGAAGLEHDACPTRRAASAPTRARPRCG